MTKATIDDIDVAGRRVLLRVDFNVPLRGGRVVDDRRIREALPTITALRERGARTIIVTHIGRPRGRVERSLTVAPVAHRLGELLGVDVPVAGDVVGSSAQATVAALRDGDVAMLENVRFEPGEERNDAAFSERLAAFADVFVNDAFGTAHRSHASTEGVAHHLPAVAGLLMARELEVLGAALDNPRRPVVAVLGGAKISTKLGLLTSLLGRVDSLHIGGAMACTFFRAKGAGIGRSLVEEDRVGDAAELLGAAARSTASLHLPVDVLVAAEPVEGAAPEVVAWNAIPDDRMVVDIGPETVAAITASFAAAGTVIWNGPLGIYEIEAFARGTRELARALGESAAVSIVGGGDLDAAVEDAGVCDDIDFISTGGGATLAFLEGRTLPGVAALRDRELATP
ncbi:MAG TPA: phosphoglycerate kinase [Candidatus Dormibacteraeota bacterium]|nr:phosphoglycerate kinase [Candidatus Dormibacteraeota bacterium]